MGFLVSKYMADNSSPMDEHLVCSRFALGAHMVVTRVLMSNSRHPVSQHDL